jgi:hypothetical protein
MADQLISPGNSKHYYESVRSFMQEHGSSDIDDFYRLFTVPGMKHWYVLQPIYPCRASESLCFRACSKVATLQCC